MKRTIATATAIGIMSLGALDSQVLDVPPVSLTTVVAGETITAKETNNVVNITMPWKGQKGIVMRYNMGAPSLSERIDDVRKIQVFAKNKTNLGADMDMSSLEYGLVLSQKPATNRFCWTIEGAEDYRWEKQLPLTPQDIEQGWEQPENVVNSFAIYHKTLRNHKVGDTNYETGKFAHRYRAQAIDANNNTVWGDSDYSNGTLCDIIPSSWLNTAVYPVTI